MAFLTERKARAALRGRGLQFAVSELRKSAASSMSTRFDVFLSHSFSDAEIIAGVKALLEEVGRSVYVDWIEDRHLDRTRVTVQTAEVLRIRMRNSRSLIFATSRTSSTSKWMPWELGFFDGYRPGHVAVLPLVETTGATFEGQEYLGLYPYVEELAFSDGRAMGIRTGSSTAVPVSTFPTVAVATRM